MFLLLNDMTTRNKATQQTTFNTIKKKHNTNGYIKDKKKFYKKIT